MINLSNFEENLKSGVIKLVKIGNSYAASKKVFDTDTGKELPLVVETIDIADLKCKLVDLQKGIEGLKSLIAQLESLK